MAGSCISCSCQRQYILIFLWLIQCSCPGICMKPNSLSTQTAKSGSSLDAKLWLVASGVETSACRVLFLQEDYFDRVTSSFLSFFPFWRKSISQIQAEYEGNNIILSCFICRQNSLWLKWCYFLWILYWVFLSLWPISPPTPCQLPLQEFSDPGAGWKCFCLSDLTQLIVD